MHLTHTHTHTHTLHGNEKDVNNHKIIGVAGASENLMINYFEVSVHACVRRERSSL